MYVCKSCNHKSNDVNNMKRHILTVHPTIYKCDYCDYESEKKDDLFAHQVGFFLFIVFEPPTETFNFSTMITASISLILTPRI